MLVSRAWAQEGTTIPPAYRGTEDAVARGIMNGNLIETNYRNHGEMARWNDTYYHRADTQGIGFDRTDTGSNAVAQYFAPLREVWGSRERCPEKYLLWFHYVPWDYQVGSGRTLWEELGDHYYRGVETVRCWQQVWNGLRAFVDSERFEQIAAFLRIQEIEAVWWRNACILYFQTFSQRPIPAGYEQPVHTLDYYIEPQQKLQRFPLPGHWIGQ